MCTAFFSRKSRSWHSRIHEVRHIIWNLCNYQAEYNIVFTFNFSSSSASWLDKASNSEAIISPISGSSSFSFPKLSCCEVKRAYETVVIYHRHQKYSGMPTFCLFKLLFTILKLPVCSHNLNVFSKEKRMYQLMKKSWSNPTVFG